MGVLNWMDLTISPVRREYRSAQQYGGLVLKTDKETLTVSEHFKQYRKSGFGADTATFTNNTYYIQNLSLKDITL